LEKIKDLSDRLHSAPEKLFEAFETPLSELSAFAVFLEEFFSSSRNDLIKIISLRDSGDCRLKIAPLDVSKVLSEKLWSRLDACVLTSATLTIGNTFDFLKKSLALGNFEFHILDSDFDYSKQAMIFLPTDFGDVRNESDRIRVNEFVQDAILAVGGRTLGLFTSFASIREAYLQINANLRNAGIKLLTQGLSGGKHKMIEEFKRDSHRSALF
jgi:ATP-dependent DNA helicase DinG